MQKLLFFIIKLQSIRVLSHTSSYGVVDKIRDLYDLGDAFESRAPTVFYLPTRKYFMI